ncbi:TIGR02996 domain-containing protein [Gemmata sp. G18]|uniref:TIGR02996 domain-containing protein n=1 Tax=Gemmata palustris TaxID=2822762 RepID=A0ABS5BTQ0_9BACT|nr:TIGR02996 domain-containing protein [Gemmata palustris]MBP3956675.1 TIGR02996 domain-containing protein [Gemmata palustris]
MSDRSALLAAICAHPGDDTPRLVFADWLDENEPDAKRSTAEPSAWAALIRTECELARLRDDDSAAAKVFDYCERMDRLAIDWVRWPRALPAVARRAELYRAAERLRPLSAKARTKGLPKSGAAGIVWDEDTDRGFPARVTVRNWKKFGAALPALAAACPRVRVDFDFDLVPTGHEAIKGLAAWCRDLSVHVSKPEHADMLVALSASPQAAGVRKLFVSSRDEHGTRALAAIADSPHWSGVNELSIHSAVELPADLRDRLFRAPHLRGLRAACFNGRGTAPTIEALCPLPRLRVLAFFDGALGDGEAVELANAPGLAALRELHIGDTGIADRGIGALLASLALCGLTVLHIESKAIEYQSLAHSMARGLRIAAFPKCRLNAASPLELECFRDHRSGVNEPRPADIVYFDAGTNLAQEDFGALLKWFGDRAPACFVLRESELGAEGARALATWPAAAHIDVLDFWGVEINATGAQALASSPYLAQLQYFRASPVDGTAHAILEAGFRNCFHIGGSRFRL